jgi:hypothetical protein
MSLQNFLKSAAARSLPLADMLRMSDAEAEAMFRQVRWPETNGEPVKAAPSVDFGGYWQRAAS